MVRPLTPEKFLVVLRGGEKKERGGRVEDGGFFCVLSPATRHQTGYTYGCNDPSPTRPT